MSFDLPQFLPRSPERNTPRASGLPSFPGERRRPARPSASTPAESEDYGTNGDARPADSGICGGEL